MLAEAVSPQCAGIDRVFGEENAWGLASGSAATATGWGRQLRRHQQGRRLFDRFATGSAGTQDRVDALEDTLRNCLGLPPLPGTSNPPQPS